MSLTFTDTASPAWVSSPSSPLTVSASIGTASADRIVQVLIGVDGNATNGVVSAVTINGVTATKQVFVNPDGTDFLPGVYIYSALVTAGSGAQNIVITFSAFPSGIGILVGTVTGDAAATVTATGIVGPSQVADPHSISGGVTIPSGGVGVICVGVDRAATLSWTGATDDGDTTEGAGNLYSLHMAHTTSNTPSFTGANSFEVTMIEAAWGPSGGGAARTPTLTLLGVG